MMDWKYGSDRGDKEVWYNVRNLGKMASWRIEKGIKLR
jgi:hypothetical protein